LRINWQIDPEDVAQVKDFLERQRDNAFVRKRIEINLRADKPPVTKKKFWYTMVELPICCGREPSVAGQDWTSPYWKTGYNLAYAGKWRDRPRAGSSEAK
jgi:hypothetical protein